MCVNVCACLFTPHTNVRRAWNVYLLGNMSHPCSVRWNRKQLARSRANTEEVTARLCMDGTRCGTQTYMCTHTHTLIFHITPPWVKRSSDFVFSQKQGAALPQTEEDPLFVCVCVSVCICLQLCACWDKSEGAMPTMCKISRSRKELCMKCGIVSLFGLQQCFK